MPDFHYGPSRSEKFNSIRIKGRVFNIKKNKKKTVVVLTIIKIMIRITIMIMVASTIM